jgi:hypothetical protein
MPGLIRSIFFAADEFEDRVASVYGVPIVDRQEDAEMATTNTSARKEASR